MHPTLAGLLRAPLATPLPIEAVLEPAIDHLRRQRALVLEAPPGAGKTTLVPLALLAAGFAEAGELLVLQPRRLAARMAASRVASLLGEAVGERVGYQIRFDSKVGPATVIRYLTEGLLLRRLRDDPELHGVTTVILDEFHERHLDGDLALALLRRLQARRSPPLHLLVMSATLDAAPIAEFLGAPRLRSDGRAYAVTIDYAGARGDTPLPAQVHRALHDLHDLHDRMEREDPATGGPGDLLIFLPGAREIRACAAAASRLAARVGAVILPLHGDLPPAEQDRALAPQSRPKWIFATNVAETSITIDGITTVIDSGLCRRASVNPWTGIPTLEVAPIARDAAAQRAGRAGRTRPGRCIRLYSRHDHDHRPAHTPPEIARLDLAGALLDLHAAGITDLASFPWFEAPPAPALAAAEELLQRLGAIDPQGALTATGRAMLPYPVHPRLARVLVDGITRGIPDLAADAAAILGERSLRPPQSAPAIDADADLLVDLEELAATRGDPDLARQRGLHPAACRQLLRVRDQLRRLARRQAARAGDRRGAAAPRRLTREEREEREQHLRLALLTGFPDRVGCARGEGDARTLVLAGGGSARLDATVVRSAPWMVALALEDRRDRRDRRSGGEPRVTSAAAIEPEWLLDLFPERIVDREELTFDRARGRVVARSELVYDGLILDASERSRWEPAPPPAVSERLAQEALAAGPERFVRDPAALAALVRRSRFAATLDPECPALDEAAIRRRLHGLCAGLSGFAELEAADLLAHLQADLQAAVGDRLHRLAPTHLGLPSGRRVAIDYPEDPTSGEAPAVRARLQEFFGCLAGPTVGDGRIPLVLHLLAPNGRDVQVTTDLAGFWERHYPGLRRALMRRYPKHPWPEDPRSAEPPRARPRGARGTRNKKK